MKIDQPSSSFPTMCYREEAIWVLLNGGHTLHTLHASRVPALLCSPIKRPFGRLPYQRHADGAPTAPGAWGQRCLSLTAAEERGCRLEVLSDD